MPDIIERARFPAYAWRTVAFLFWACVFGAAYTQAPLYYSNQNQYFLHGLADGGLGLLHEDWLANTRDPTPIFSGVVAFTVRHLDVGWFYGYYLLVLGIYFAGLTGLFTVLTGQPAASWNYAVFIAAVVAVHSGLLRLLSTRLMGVDYPWYAQAGLAGQYVLGPTLQPSTMGVLLIFSIYLFLADQPRTATACCCLAAVLHTTYLLSAGIIILAYLYVLMREGRNRDLAWVAGMAVLLVTPSVVYALRVFGPTSAVTFAEAQDILVHFRIPHHCVLARWLDWIAGLQIAWIGLAIYLARGTRLVPILALSVAIGVVLSIVQVATGNNTLALLFPWRVSIYLVPIATAVVLTRLVVAADRIVAHRTERAKAVLRYLALGIVAGLAIAGLAIQYGQLAYQMGDEELAMMDYVRDHVASGDVYLVPVDLPPPAGKRGQFSGDFRTLAMRRQGSGMLPIELQRFRLYTGAPIFVDFKAIPYRDVEVLEWARRIQINQELYAKSGADFQDLLREVRSRHRITHVIVRAGHDVGGDGLERVYADANYAIFRVKD